MSMGFYYIVDSCILERAFKTFFLNMIYKTIQCYSLITRAHTLCCVI